VWPPVAFQCITLQSSDPKPPADRQHWCSASVCQGFAYFTATSCIIVSCCPGPCPPPPPPRPPTHPQVHVVHAVSCTMTSTLSGVMGLRCHLRMTHALLSSTTWCGTESGGGEGGALHTSATQDLIPPVASGVACVRIMCHIHAGLVSACGTHLLHSLPKNVAVIAAAGVYGVEP
jgi:hypothetical protein